MRCALRWGAAGFGAASIARVFPGCGDPPPPLSPCEPAYDDPPIGWGPSVIAPVFYGYTDHDASVGAPGPVRVYYPSLDGAPQCGPILTGPGHFPLVLFLHGQCVTGSEDHYTTWSRLPAVLARSGYIVAIPDLSGITDPWVLDNATYALVLDVLDWMRTGWSHASLLMSDPTLGIVGHSYGALHGGQLASTLAATAYVSLGGVWTEWPGSPPSPLNTLAVPKLLSWGTNDFAAALPAPNFAALPSPRYSLVFPGGEHWDYVPPEVTVCETLSGSQAGACGLTDELAADLTAVFLSRYMPPEEAGILDGFIPDDLVLPAVGLTADQQFFAGNHLTSFGMVASTAGCSGITLTWDTPGSSGSRTL